MSGESCGANRRHTASVRALLLGKLGAAEVGVPVRGYQAISLGGRAGLP